MSDALLSAWSQFATLPVLFALLIAIPAGLVFGLLPGLGGLSALAILIPFVYGADPLTGLSFLLATHAVVYTGGSVTAILLGIPGAPANAATVIDGYPLSRQGRAGYAIGAALTSSALGGVFGALVLAVLIPFLRPIVEAFGSPETFFLALLGVTFIGAVGGSSPLRGLIAGLFGIFLTTFGVEAVTGEARFWLGFDYLLDGFQLIPIALGLFAVPEIIDMVRSGGSIAEDRGAERISWRQVAEGVWSVPQRFWLLLRSSLLGVFIGILPGVGGETAPFVSYAWGKQAARNAADWGKGVIEGVIAPESANNAKEGGALVPTLAFGIPGSSGMALLLSGFLILGLQPGPEFLKNHLDIAFGLVFVLVVANLLAAAVMLAVTSHAAQITRISGWVMGPLLLALVVLGAYSTRNNGIDVAFVFAFGALGYFMKAYDYSRAALMLGFVLGGPIETYFHISMQAYGPLFFTRPLCLVLIALIVAGIAVPLLRRRG